VKSSLYVVCVCPCYLVLTMSEYDVSKIVLPEQLGNIYILVITV
jgi:hypothetical protein